MKFSTRQDINAPIEFVFDRASDFDGFERQALRRGLEIERIAEPRADGTGMSWEACFPFRGKQRRVEAEIAMIDPPNALAVTSVSGGVAAEFELELLALSRGRTRLRVGLLLLPKSLSARLLIQSMKFTKHSLDKRFARRVEQFGRDIEAVHGKSRAAVPGKA